MILIDTSIWVDHLRWGDPKVEPALDAGQVLMHPFVLGELALGVLKPRQNMLTLLQSLPSAQVGDNDEVLAFIEEQALWSSGIGYVDAHLLVGTRLTPDAVLWTRDKRLRSAAMTLGLAADL